ncbi:MAG: hypothetical protein HY367_00405 [Candidatus Aenigmarchaeota archaeon]|nr:hypothetical protein [Candidatus Aenigmarchaeota archaeon]
MNSGILDLEEGFQRRFGIRPLDFFSVTDEEIAALKESVGHDIFLSGWIHSMDRTELRELPDSLRLYGSLQRIEGCLKNGRRYITKLVYYNGPDNSAYSVSLVSSGRQNNREYTLVIDSVSRRNTDRSMDTAWERRIKNAGQKETDTAYVSFALKYCMKYISEDSEEVQIAP